MESTLWVQSGVRARMDERTGFCRVATGRGQAGALSLMTSDAGILLLAAIEQRLGIAKRSADCLEYRRDPERVRHTVAEMIRHQRPVDRGGLSQQ
jgi:hypothetical protein